MGRAQPLLVVIALVAALPALGEPGVLECDRHFRALPPPDGPSGARGTLAAAAMQIGGGEIDLAGVRVNRSLLLRLAGTPDDEPLVRGVREALRRPAALDDLLYFLDDAVPVAATGNAVVVTPDRARRFGIFLHPDEVFKGRTRAYGKKYPLMPIDPPEEQAALEPPPDGAPLGPSWTARYENPEDESEQLRALGAVRPEADLHQRVALLVGQLRAQGAEVSVESTVRARERGYLMWGAFWLSRARTRAQVQARVKVLQALNDKWGLEVPIRWGHPKGWQATREEARRMAEAYNVVFATRSGAQRSNHYDGLAVDITAVGLPRQLTLLSPSGAEQTFDLSDPQEARDLSLTPAVIAWVEEHYGLKKLQGDYPHWDDAR